MTPEADPDDEGAEAAAVDDGTAPSPGPAADGSGAAGANATDGDEPAESLLAALSVAEHARVGLAVGLGLAGFLYVVRFPALELSATGSGGYYLGLALVLAATTAATVTAALSLKTFLAPVLDAAAWRRRGAAAAMLGGVTWAGLGLLAALAESGTISTGVWRTATSLGAIALVIGAMALHAVVDDATGRLERAAYWIVIVALVFAAGNATGDPSPVTVTDDGPLATPFLLAAFVATVATIPLAATAELSGELPPRRTRALQFGALVGTLGVAWLLGLGGWETLATSDLSTVPAALAVATLAPGLGWAVAGHGLWRSATPARLAGRSPDVTVEERS